MSELALQMVVALPRVERARLALLLLESEAEEITFRRGGTRWTACPWDHLTSETLFVDGDFQGPKIRALVDWLTRHCRFAAPRNVVFDVGAKIGTSTIPIARQTGCRIVAVEAVPEMFAVLCRNVADNGLASRVICVQAAIDRAVSGRIQIIPPAGGSGEVSGPDLESSLARQLPNHANTEAPAIGLRCLLDATGIAPDQVAFVWSDTQGREREVIKTGSCLWAAGVPLFAKFDPTYWGSPADLATLVRVATGRFAGFIPSETVIAATDPKPRAITELENFCRTIDAKGTEILLLP